MGREDYEKGRGEIAAGGDAGVRPEEVGSSGRPEGVDGCGGQEEGRGETGVWRRWRWAGSLYRARSRNLETYGPLSSSPQPQPKTSFF